MVMTPVLQCISLSPLLLVCCQASHERAAACAQAESLAAQLSSKGRECDAFQAALLSEQRRVDELQAVRSRVMGKEHAAGRWRQQRAR